MADGSVTFKLFGQDVSASAAMRKVGDQAKKTAKDVESVGKKSTRAARDTDTLGGSLRSLRSGPGVQAVITGLQALAAAAGAAATAIAVTGVKQAAFNEQAMISLNTLIGSADKAQQHFEDLKEFAANTPFELPGLIEADRLMLGVGMRARDVIPYLTLWGDTAGALGLSQEQFSRVMRANSQAISSNRYMIEDLNQITENGVPITMLLSEATGKSAGEIRKMAEEGQLTVDMFNRLFPVMQKKYGGSMEEQAQTLSGLWSTLRDKFSQGAADALVAAGVIDKLKDGINAAFPMMDSFFAALARDLPGLLDRIQPGVQDFMAFMAWVRDNGPMVASSVGNLAGALYNLAGALAGSVTSGSDMSSQAFTMSESMNRLADSINGLTDFINGNAGAFKALGAAYSIATGGMFRDIDKLSTWVGSALSAILRAVSTALDAMGSAVSVVPGVGEAMARSFHTAALAVANDARGIDTVIQAIRNRDVYVRVVTFQSSGLPGGSTYEQQVPSQAGAARRMTQTPAVPALPDLGYISGIGGGSGGGGGGAGKAAETARKNAIKAVGKDLGRQFAKALLSSRADLVRAFDKLMGDLANTGDKQAKAIAKRARGRLLELAKTHDRVVKQLKAAKDKLKELREESRDFARQTRDDIVETGNVASEPGSFGQITFNLNKALFRARQFAAVMGRLKKAGLDKTSMRQLMEAGPAALESAWSILNSGKGGIGQIANLQKQLRDAGTAAGATGSSALYDAGIKAADGLVKGLQKREGAIAKVMRRIAKQMIRAIKKELGIKSPSKVAEGIGGYFGDGLIQGMTKKIPLVNATAAGMLDASVSGGYTAYRPPAVGPAQPVVNHYHFPGAVIGSEAHIVRTVEAAQARVSGQGRKR